MPFQDFSMCWMFEDDVIAYARTLRERGVAVPEIAGWSSPPARANKGERNVPLPTLLTPAEDFAVEKLVTSSEVVYELISA